MARIACSPQPWGDALFENALDEIAGAGYAGIEILDPAVERFRRQPARLRGLLEERELKIAAIPFSGTYFDRDERKEELDRLRLSLDILAEAGGEGAVVTFRAARHAARRDMVAGLPPLLPLSRDRMAALADTVNQLCDVCLDFGMVGAFSNRVGTYIETPDELEEVMSRTEPALVQLAPDLGHWAYAGGDPAVLVRQHSRRIAYLRVKDVDQAVLTRVKSEREGFRHFLRDGGFRGLGEGSLDLEAALMPLVVAEYEGWVSFELEVADQPREAAQASREYLRTRLHW